MFILEFSSEILQAIFGRSVLVMLYIDIVVIWF